MLFKSKDKLKTNSRRCKPNYLLTYLKRKLHTEMDGKNFYLLEMLFEMPGHMASNCLADISQSISAGFFFHIEA